VYTETGAKLLAKVFARALHADVARRRSDSNSHAVQCIYVHTLHRYDVIDNDFFDALVGAGLDYCEATLEGSHSVALTLSLGSPFMLQKVTMTTRWLMHQCTTRCDATRRDRA
jgi:hypothetical protein